MTNICHNSPEDVRQGGGGIDAEGLPPGRGRQGGQRRAEAAVEGRERLGGAAAVAAGARARGAEEQRHRGPRGPRAAGDCRHDDV